MGNTFTTTASSGVAGILTVSDLYDYYSKKRVDDLVSEQGTLTLAASKLVQAANDEVRNALSFQYTDDQMIANTSVQMIAACIARYLLESRRGVVPADALNAYQVAQKKLTDLRDGTTKLADVPQLLPRINNERSIPSLYEKSGMFGGYGVVSDPDNTTPGDFGVGDP